MKINVWKAYQGNRCQHTIEEGVYDSDDPEINGLARYLIDNGNAHEASDSDDDILARADKMFHDSHQDVLEEIFATEPVELIQRTQEAQDEYLKQHHESLIIDKPRKTRSDKGKPRGTK